MNDITTQSVFSYSALLRNRSYAALWLGQLVSTFGDRLHQVALLVLVGSLTANDMGQIGLVVATIGLPSLFFGLMAGAVVDRWDRRHVMIVADLIRVVLVTSIPTLARINISWVYVITFLLTTASIFFRPAKDGIIPQIVPEHGLLSANSFSSGTESAIDVLGYPLAGALVGGFAGMLAGTRGIDLAFYIDAGTYLFSALMIAQMRVARQVDEDAEAPISGLARMVIEGLQFVRSNRIVLANFLLIVSSVLVASGTMALDFGYATEVVGSGGFGFSILEAALGFGSIIGACVIGKWGGCYRKGPLIVLGLITLGIADGSLTIIKDLWFAAAMLVFSGFANMVFFIPSITLVQEVTPEPLLGRVFSLRSTLVTTALIMSNVVLGFGAEQFGVQHMFGLAGGLLVLIGALGFLFPSIRRVR